MAEQQAPRRCLESSALIVFQASRLDVGWLVEAPAHSGGGVTAGRLFRAIEAAWPLLEAICEPDIDLDQVEVRLEVVASAEAAAIQRQVVATAQTPASAEATRATHEAVHILVDDEHISFRDASALLGRSVQYLKKLHQSPTPVATNRRPGPIVPIIARKTALSLRERRPM